jgi:hypothetical protein
LELCCAVLAVGSEDGVPCVELCGCDSVVSREEAAVVAADGVFIFVAAGYDAALGWVGERAGCCCGSGGCAAGTGRAAGDLDAIIVSVVFWRLGDVCRWFWKLGTRRGKRYELGPELGGAVVAIWISEHGIPYRCISTVVSFC